MWWLPLFLTIYPESSRWSVVAALARHTYILRYQNTSIRYYRLPIYIPITFRRQVLFFRYLLNSLQSHKDLLSTLQYIIKNGNL